MKDSIRESLSYFGLFKKLLLAKKHTTPEKVMYGTHKDQYFLYYEPENAKTDKMIFWVHGGGWNSGNPSVFDYVGQAITAQGYRFVSAGYRLSPKYRYPRQIEDVCECFVAATGYLKAKGIDTSQIVIAGPSAGAHLSSILCYCRKVQQKYCVDLSGVIGFVGWGGPYSFSIKQPLMLSMLLDMLFKKGYDRRNGEPVKLMNKSDVPMLLIQSRHDGLIPYESAEDFAEKARRIGNSCELYTVTDKKDTHSWYTAGMFFEDRKSNKGLDKFYSWVEDL
ncbi:MAG: alpha/beta hydrolase [Oscillospiraceae bacterium]|nr:alpha/beta hydrolase [Oscillospiraceae bacterium]